MESLKYAYSGALFDVMRGLGYPHQALPPDITPIDGTTHCWHTWANCLPKLLSLGALGDTLWMGVAGSHLFINSIEFPVFCKYRT